MPRYKLYFIEKRPRHIRDIAEFESHNDDDAKQAAGDRRDCRAMELWRDDEVIHCYPAVEDQRGSGET